MFTLDFKSPTRLPRSRAGCEGLGEESPHNDSDFQHDIIWDATSPSPNRASKENETPPPPPPSYPPFSPNRSYALIQLTRAIKKHQVFLQVRDAISSEEAWWTSQRSSTGSPQRWAELVVSHGHPSSFLNYLSVPLSVYMYHFLFLATCLSLYLSPCFYLHRFTCLPSICPLSLSYV